MAEDPKRKSKRIGFAAIAIAAIVTVSLVVVFTIPQNPGPGTPASYSKKVMFSELQVMGAIDDQFIELYTWASPGHDLSGWTITHMGRTATLPAISNLGAFTYIVIRFGPGTSDTDASDKNATIYLGTGVPFLDPQGSITLTDHLGRVVDFYHWGNVVPVNPVDWPATDFGIMPSGLLHESMQCWGEDMDNSTNWIVDNSTAGLANAINFNVTTSTWGNITVELSTGINQPLPTVAGGDYRFENETVVTGTPAPWITKGNITEMAEFTLKHYAGLGFMKPYLGSDGKLNIQVSNSSKPYSTGSCDRYGNIKVNLGQKGGKAGLVGTKYTVEHEIMHALQAHAESSNIDHWGNNGDDPFQEGMATWGGLSSTMKNYNLTWNETMAYMKEVGKANWFDHYRDINTTLWPWPTTGGWDRYMGNGLFVKFLNETYGNGTLGKIMVGIKTYLNGTAIKTAQESIAAECGKSFDQVWRAYHEWLVNGSATKANKFPALPPHSTPQAPSGPTTPPFKDGPKTVVPWGGDIEFINCVNKTTRFNIGFGDFDGNTHWKISIIYTYPNGTTVTRWFTILGTASAIPVDPSKWANITIVKTRIGTDGNGKISITLTPVTASSTVGSSRQDPHHSNCSAGSPPETTTAKIRVPPESFFDVWFTIWIENGSALGILATNTTGGAMENYLGIEVHSFNTSVPVDRPTFAPPEQNPKSHVISCQETTYYFIRIFWDDTIRPFPPAAVDVEVELFFV